MPPSKAAAGAISRSSRRRGGSTSTSTALGQLAEKVGPLFELPCALGAAAAGAPAAAEEAMSAYGRALGLAYVLTEEQRALRHLEPQPTSVLAADLSRGVLSIPILLAARRPALHDAMSSLLARRPIDHRWLALVMQDGDVGGSVIAMAESHAQNAKKALTSLPHAPHRVALERIADYSVTREIIASQFEMP